MKNNNLFAANKINFKSFNLQGLQSINPDIFFRFEHNGKEKPTKADNLTISEHFLISYLSKGSENLYFDFSVYLADEPNNETEFLIKCHTKDQHEELKEIIFELIKQS
jgi:hypothetical protein